MYINVIFDQTPITNVTSGILSKLSDGSLLEVHVDINQMIQIETYFCQ